jgi:hypothetical protein
MDTTAIYIVPDENFDDWVVRDESGHELGHYPTRKPPSWSPGLSCVTVRASTSFASLTGAQLAKDCRPKPLFCNHRSLHSLRFAAPSHLAPIVSGGSMPRSAIFGPPRRARQSLSGSCLRGVWLPRLRKTKIDGDPGFRTSARIVHRGPFLSSSNPGPPG